MMLYDKMQMERNEEEGRDELLSSMPELYRKKFAEMMDAEAEDDYLTMIRLGEELKKDGCEVLELHVFLSRAYLNNDEVEKAIEAVRVITDQDPKDFIAAIQLAVCYQVTGNNKKTAELLKPFYPPEEYLPFYYTTYANSLVQLEKYEQAHEVYSVVVKEFWNGYDPGSTLMDGVFQQLIEIDMIADASVLEEDVEQYMKFLKTLKCTEEEQSYMTGNLVLFAGYLSNKRYRPIFKKLLDFIGKEDLLTDRVSLSTWNSGYVSLETYAISEDKRVSRFMKDLLECERNVGTEEDRELDELVGLTEGEKASQENYLIEGYVRKYCGSKRLSGIFEEFSYMQEEYLHNYKYLVDYEKELLANPEKTEEKYLELMIASDDSGQSADRLKQLYDKFYASTYEGGTLAWDSASQDTYKRTGKKIGRNDFCPCGSGKKYKKCCGKEQ